MKHQNTEAKFDLIITPTIDDLSLSNVSFRSKADILHDQFS